MANTKLEAWKKKYGDKAKSDTPIKTNGKIGEQNENSASSTKTSASSTNTKLEAWKKKYSSPRTVATNTETKRKTASASVLGAGISATAATEENILKGLWNNIGYDTFATDFENTSKLINTLSSGWQTPETMAQSKSTIEKMRQRVGNLLEYQYKSGLKSRLGDENLLNMVTHKPFEYKAGDPVSDPLKNAYDIYGEVLDSWDDRTNYYGLYNDADSYDKEQEELNKLFTMTATEIEKVPGYKTNSTAYKTVTGEKIKWQDLYADVVLKEYEQAVDDKHDINKNGDYVKSEEKPYEFNIWSENYVIKNRNRFIYNLVNGDEDTMAAADLYDNKTFTDYRRLAHASEEEKKRFNTLWKLEGEEAAIEYANKLEKALRSRYVAAENARWAEMAKEYPVGSSIFSVGDTLFNAIPEGFATLLDYASGNEIDPNSPFYKSSRRVSTVRGTVSDMIDSDVGKFFYGAGMSLADNVAAMAAGGFGKLGVVSKVAQTSIMSSRSFTQTTLDAKRRGLSDDQAFALGAISGAAEMAFESKSFDALFGGGNLSKGAFGYFVDNMKTELIGELGTELTNDVADFFIAQDESKWVESIKAYQREGMSENDAIWETFCDNLGKYLEVAGTTLLTTGTISGTTSISLQMDNTSIGKTLRGSDQVSTMFELAANSPVSTQLHEAYANLAKKGITAENITDSQLGNLYRIANTEAYSGMDAAEKDKAKAESVVGKQVDIVASDKSDAKKEKAQQKVDKVADSYANANTRIGQYSEMQTKLAEIDNAVQLATEPDSLEKAAMDVVANRNTTPDSVAVATERVSTESNTTPTPETKTAETGSKRATAQMLDEISSRNEMVTVEEVKAVSGFGDNGSQLITELANTEGTTYSRAKNAVTSAYMAARTGVEKKSTAFETELQEKAFDAGILDRHIELAERIKKANDATVYEGEIEKSEYYKRLPRQAKKMAKSFAKDFGLSERFVDKLIAAVVDGKTYYANAQHKDGVLSRASDSDNPVHEDLVHEALHRMMQVAPQETSSLIYALYEQATQSGRAANLGVDISVFDSVKEEHDDAGLSMNTLDILEEIAAREMQTIFDNAKEFNQWRAKLKSDANLNKGWKKVVEFISELIEKIKTFVSQLAGTSKEKAKAQEVIEVLERYADAYKATMKAVAKKNSQNSGEIKKNESYNGDVKNALKKRTNHNPYHTNGMIWAYNADTKIGDLKVLYNPYKGKHVLVEATKDDIGFIELSSGTAKQMTEELENYERERLITESRAVNKVLRDFGIGQSDHDGNYVDAGYRGEGSRNADVFEGEPNSDRTADSPEAKRNSAGITTLPQKSKDTQYLELAKNPEQNEAKLREMVEEAAKKVGYTQKLYHGTNQFGFTVFEGTEGFDYDDIQFFTTDSLETANTYAGTNKVRRVSEKYELDYDIEDEYEQQAREVANDLASFMSAEVGYRGYIEADYLVDAVKTGNDEDLYEIEDEWLADIYHNEYTDSYEEFYEFQESEEGEMLSDKFHDYLGQIKKTLEALDNYETSGIYEFVANTENLFVIDGEGKNWNALEDTRLPERTMTNGFVTDDGESHTSYVGALNYLVDQANKQSAGGTGFEVKNTTTAEKGGTVNVFCNGIKLGTISKKEIKLKYKTRDVCLWAKENGYSGVLFKNIKDSGSAQKIASANVYAFFNPREQVKSADPVTYDDNGNIIPLSERFNKDNDDIRYSLKKGSTTSVQDRKELLETIEQLKHEFELTTFAKADPKKLAAMTKKLVKDYDSRVDLDETNKAIDELYTYIANGEDGHAPVWEDVYEKASEIASSIIENAVVVDDELYRDYKGLRDYLRKVPMRFYEGYDDVPSGYENFNDFRRKNYGRFNFTKDGMSIDIVYQELASMYPEYFNAEEHTDTQAMLEHMVDVLDSIQPIEVNPHDGHMREITAYLASDIIDRFFDIPQAKPTFADKAERKLTKAHIEAKKKLDRVRDQRDAKIEKLMASQRAKTKKLIEQAKEKKAEAISKERQKRKDALAKMSESKKAQVLRTRIFRHTSELSQKLLRPSDNKHIPQDLQGLVTVLLESINLESNVEYVYGTDAKYHRVKRGSELVAEPTKRTQAFVELRELYRSLESSLTIDPDLTFEFGLLSEVIKLGDKPIAAMNSTELDAIWQTIKAVEATISTADKAFSASKFKNISEIAEALRADNAGKSLKKELRGILGKGQKLTSLDMLTPETFLHYLGDAGDTIFRMMRDAQDKHITIMKEVSDFTHKALKGVNVNKLEKTLHTVKLGGQSVELTTAQLMELYVLNKRKQAVEHIFIGGILPDVIDTKGIFKKTKADPIRNITQEEVGAALTKLTAEEKAVADKLQKFVSTVLSQYGNEASMKVYNYEKFLEENYWTIRTNKQEIASDVGKDTAVTSVANKGMAKGTVPHANTSVRIGSIFDTFASHSSDMATYAAWLGATEDINRIRNFVFWEDGARTGTVKGIIDTVHGTQGSQYLNKLLTDISIGVRGEDNMNPLDKLTGHYKAASVSANIRVIVQQPTAILRALDMIEPQYIVAGAYRPLKGWEKAKEHAPIAQWKDWGHFDINTGRQMKDVLFDNASALEKAKQVGMWGASKADSLSWGMLWNAVEMETRAKHKELEVGSDEYYTAVSKRFTEIVDHTQVVDGILQRSGIMRSPDSLTKMATSFMGEPTKQYNMAMSAAYDARTKSGKAKAQAVGRLGRTALSLTGAAIINACAQSFVDALRDDDKEKDYWEKWLEAFKGGEDDAWFQPFGNIGDNFNPIGFVPFVKDVLSVFQGYDVKRMDMEVISKTSKAVENMYKAITGTGKYTIGESSATLFAEVARLFGLPVANVKRDVKSVATTIATETDNYLMQYRMEKAILDINYAGNRKNFMDILFNAYNNDREAYEFIYKDMLKSGYAAETIQSGMNIRMLKAEGVTKVSELSKRYMSPETEKKYDSNLKKIQSSGVWKSANAEQKKKAEADLYSFMTSTSESVEKLRTEARAFGVDETEYTLWQLAKEMADDGNGSLNAKEKAEAIEMLELGNAELAYFYNTKQADEAYAYGIDMTNYALFKAAVSGLKGDNKERMVKTYAKEFSDNEKERLFFMGTEYDSWKKRKDYIGYFGK